MLSIEGKIAGTDITFDEDHPPVLGGTVLSAATYQKTLKSTSDGKSLLHMIFFIIQVEAMRNCGSLLVPRELLLSNIRSIL